MELRSSPAAAGSGSASIEGGATAGGTGSEAGSATSALRQTARSHTQNRCVFYKHKGVCVGNLCYDFSIQQQYKKPRRAAVSPLLIYYTTQHKSIIID